MSWDGLYLAKTHHYVKVDGRKVYACKRRFARNSTTDTNKVSCFACLKALGIIK